MARTLDLGRVKGDAFTYADFTQEQLAALTAHVRAVEQAASVDPHVAARVDRWHAEAVDAIAAALARVKEKQAQAMQPVVIQAGEKPDNSAVIAAREARKAQARAARAENSNKIEDSSAGTDPRKAAVEAAIARAKARKLEQQPVTETAEPVDPRKAAVEAAIARAKARKLEQQSVTETAEPVDPRKAAVEAAIARAKARKLEQQPVTESAEPVDPRKAAVAAAIARAQAKKAAQQQVVNEE